MTAWDIHPAAKEEHDDLITLFAGIDHELAVAFEERYLACRHTICASPLLYNLRRGMTRRVNLMPRFGEYYIAYMIWREKVVILAVAHAKRKPYYWRGRIGESKKIF